MMVWLRLRRGRRRSAPVTLAEAAPIAGAGVAVATEQDDRVVPLVLCDCRVVASPRTLALPLRRLPQAPVTAAEAVAVRRVGVAVLAEPDDVFAFLVLSGREVLAAVRAFAGLLSMLRRWRRRWRGGADS